MRWEDERYVRIFTRDTPSWDAMGWEAQALLMLVFRKMDRTGLLALGNSGRRGLAACVRMPLDVVERALDVLLEDGVLTMSGKDIFCPNFMSAQECAKSDALRSREKRERAHLGLTQSVSRETRDVAQTTRSDTSAPQVDTPSVPSVPSVPNVTSAKRKKSKPAEGSPAFEAFWEAYPAHRRNLGKPAAISKWPGDEHANEIMEHLAASKASHDWQKDGGEFVLGMRRYLNDAEWKKQVVDRKPSSKPPQSQEFHWPRA